MINYDLARKDMINNQLKKKGIVDKNTLSAFEKIHRHLFVGENDKGHSYDDSALSIGYGQTISQPYIVALMTQLLKPNRNDVILEIGTGSGFQAAILSTMCKFVISIERIPELAAFAKKNISETGSDNVQIFVGDGSLGWKANAPYDGIMVTAGSEVLPQVLLAQLKPGGRMIIPLGSEDSHKLTLIKKEEDGYITEEMTDCHFVPLIGRKHNA